MVGARWYGVVRIRWYGGGGDKVVWVVVGTRWYGVVGIRRCGGGGDKVVWRRWVRGGINQVYSFQVT